MSRLSSEAARCVPSKPCPQQAQCARCTARLSKKQIEVDASISLAAGYCPMFIDHRTQFQSAVAQLETCS